MTRTFTVPHVSITNDREALLALAAYEPEPVWENGEQTIESAAAWQLWRNKRTAAQAYARRVATEDGRDLHA